MQLSMLWRRTAAGFLAVCMMMTQVSLAQAFDREALSFDSAPVSSYARALPVAVGPGSELFSGTPIKMTVTERLSSTPRGAVTADNATDMDAAAVCSILKRLDPLVVEAKETDFNLRESSARPPKVGKIVKAAFPPTLSASAPVRIVANRPMPLALSRYGPEGEVDFTPARVTVQFSQPMVALTSLSDSSKKIAAAITPAIPGSWRWLDTRTYIFEPKGNVFPGATKVTASVAGGVKSTSGNDLSKATSWSFRTPLLKLTYSFPQSEPDSLKPLMLMGFNQRVDQQAILRKLQVVVQTGNSKPLTLSSPKDLSLAQESEITPGDVLSRIIRGHQVDRLVLFKLNRTLPKNSLVTVVLPAGCPSAEGPLLSEQRQEFRFSTYGPLSVQMPLVLPRAVPKDDIRISCSNQLNPNTFNAGMVKVVPEIPGARISVKDNEISIVGTKKPGVKYAATISGAIEDVHGQRLGRPATLKFLVENYAADIQVPRIHTLTTITPEMPQDFRFYSINQKQCRVRAWRATPGLWSAYERDPSGLAQTLKKQSPVLDRAYSFKTNNALAETILDLKSTFAKGATQLLVLVDAQGREGQPALLSWIQYTDIGLSAVFDSKRLSVAARSLVDGKPIPNAQVSLYPSAIRAVTTDKDGLASISLPAHKASVMLVAKTAATSCILPHSYPQWIAKDQRDQIAWYTFTDRGVYRPGEEVHFKGFVRRVVCGPEGDVTSAPGGAPLRYTVRDSLGLEVCSGNCPIDRYGAFSGLFKLGATPALGPASIEFVLSANQNLLDKSATQTFMVQEFRRPEFQVSVVSESNPPALFGTRLYFGSEAHYFSGGQLAHADVEWNVNAARTRYTPAGWGEFAFGSSRRWSGLPPKQSELAVSTTLNLRTDAAGRNGVAVDIEDPGEATPLLVSAQATVSDVTRQTFSSKGAVLLHPSTRYVGLKAERNYFSAGKPVRFSSVVTAIDGKVCSDTKVSYKLYRQTENRQTELVEQFVRNSGAAPSIVEFKSKTGGAYLLTATSVDAEQRLNVTESQFYIYTDDWGGATARKSPRLIPDKECYNSGEVAEVTVLSPFPTADGVVTLSRSGIVSRSRFFVKDGAATLRIPIEEGYVPNIHVSVDVVGRINSTEEGFACNTGRSSAAINLVVSKAKRMFQLEVIPRELLLLPGKETSASVVVRDSQGKPAAGQQVTLVVVDEAVLALTQYKLGDPLSSIYINRSSDLVEANSYDQIQAINPKREKLTAGSQLVYERPNRISLAGYAAPGRSGGGGGAGGWGLPGAAMADIYLDDPSSSAERSVESSARPDKIRVRTNFNALATFQANLVTDTSGTASVSYRLPDNLTGYRLMAVAADNNNRFGAAESSITVRLPVMARPSAPRFLNFGDECLIPIMVQNQSSQNQTVQLVLRGTVEGLKTGLGKVATLTPGARQEFLFPAKADSVGIANFQTAVATAEHSDALEFSLPVYTPATSENVASYGTIDGDNAIAQSIAVPSDMFPQFGELKVSTSSTVLNELADAVSYISDYPYECSEQLSSKVMVLAALKDVSGAFGLAKLQGTKAARMVNSSIAKVSDRQYSDGSFALWSLSDHDHWPYLSVYVTHAFVIAKRKGFKVSDDVLQRAHSYLNNIHNDTEVKKYAPAARRAVLAYALYVRSLLNDSHPERAQKLFSEASITKQSIETLAYLSMVLQKDRKYESQTGVIRNYLNGKISETASKATGKSESSYDEWSYRLFYSGVRDDAVHLLSAIQHSPNSDVVQKLVRGLLSSRRNGAWSNTQENAFAALAIDSYFNSYEQLTPNYTASAWLGTGALLQQRFTGRSMDTREVVVPMQYLATKVANETVTLAKKGPGRLYYRLAMSYAPASLKLSSRDNGFSVARTYEAIDDPTQVRKDENGDWHIKAGALVRVKLKLKLDGLRFHVALVDPLPAGFEILNGALAGTKDVGADSLRGDAGEDSFRRYPSAAWWDHQNLRDNRAEAFSGCLWDGTYDYSYVVRAVTPGTFIAPPAKAEEMYEPETFGRTASETVIVEKR